jgi:hypothetical protein
LIHRDVCRVEFPKTAAFSASPRRSLHRYVDHPGSKVADSQSGLSAHQSLLTPRCPFMRSMHQLCWPVNNSANGYSFRPYRGGWRSLAKLVALAHRTGGNPPNRWRICRVHLGERHGRSVDELGKHGHPTCSTSNMGRSCGRGRSSGYGAGRSEAERTHDAVHIGCDSRVVGLEADRTLAPDFSDPIGSCEQTLRRWRLQ